MYLLQDGTEVTIDQIREAFASGVAVLVHGRANWHNTTALRLDGLDVDTRGECYSAWDEVWTTQPKSVNQCCGVARCRLG